MKYTIKDLGEGKCAVINDGTHKELKKVLKKAFPEDNSVLIGGATFYFSENNGKYWTGVIKEFLPKNLPVQSVKDFLKQKPEYPKVMMVWNDLSNEKKAAPRVVFMEKCGKYFAWSGAKTLKEAENVLSIMLWDNAKDIDEESIPEYTMEELVKKVGHNFKIKK